MCCVTEKMKLFIYNFMNRLEDWQNIDKEKKKKKAKIHYNYQRKYVFMKIS